MNWLKLKHISAPNSVFGQPNRP